MPSLVSTFYRLKMLCLGGVRLDHWFAERLNSGCPFLEDLVLHFCSNEFDSIQSNTLKSLVVRGCFSQVADVLVVRAPCLASLCLKFPGYCYKNGLSLVAGNSLLRASISVHDFSPRCEAMLLGSLYNVRSLELEGFSAMAILDKESDKLPTFGSLKTLCLNGCFESEHTFEALGGLLKKSPNLKKLTLQDFWVGILNIFSLPTEYVACICKLSHMIMYY
ncbi:hypothetical protein EJB05_37858 [Eragrostis curvula]|uniref:F-box/LRR-repeat protein 15/At3g58940/PEG3-like LRR domain-containing protein n=1 Tax=Eragrostis curvula TaxID=38414 RepID=A0A5J9TSN7_9POAL|nr:hypothetical protein EJB05_37858 [Eragrostis curvula]